VAADQETYSFVDDLAKSVPELAALLKQAAAGKWTPQRFADAMETTAWWRTNSDTAKQQIQLQKTDPAQYNQGLSQAQDHVRQAAASMGVTLTDAQVKSQATADLFQGLDDATLQSDLGKLYGGSSTGASGAGGNSVTLTGQINQLAAQYGVPVTKSWVDSEVRAALVAGTGAEGAQAALTQMATGVYPGLAAQLAAGQTTQQIAQPYIAMMAQTLELPDTSISLSDPTIQRALQVVPQAPSSPATPGGSAAAKPPKVVGIGAGVGMSPGAPTPAAGAGPPAAVSGGTAGMPAVTTLGDFANQLRADPRWDKTQNAVQDAYSMVHNLGTQWGFAS
jgi:hypothetical protein